MNSKFLVTLIGLALAVLAICNINFEKKSVENYGFGQQGAVKVYQSVETPCSSYGSTGLHSPVDGNFAHYPSFQSYLPPRITGTANIPVEAKLRLPEEGYMALHPEDPTSSHDVSSCPSKASCSSTKPAVRSCTVPATLPAIESKPATCGSYQAAMSGLQTDQKIVDSLAVAEGVASPNGESTNPIIYNNYVYSNKKSRLNGLGDRIRGDLMIRPHDPDNQWFRPAANPSIDLTQGALSVMGGVNNETSKGLAHLIAEYSGGAHQTIGGVDYSNYNMGNQYNGYLGSGHSDVQFTAYP